MRVPPHKKDKDLSDLFYAWQEADDELSAKAFDMVEDLPKIWTAVWTRCAWRTALALRHWTMFLTAMCIFARASDVVSLGVMHVVQVVTIRMAA